METVVLRCLKAVYRPIPISLLSLIPKFVLMETIITAKRKIILIEKLYKDYRNLVFFCEKLLYYKQYAEDIVSETFIMAYNKAEEFEAIENMRMWVVKVIRNKCMDINRLMKGRERVHKRIADDAKLSISEEYIMDSMIGKEIDKLIRSILTKVETMPLTWQYSLLLSCQDVDREATYSKQYEKYGRAVRSRQQGKIIKRRKFVKKGLIDPKRIFEFRKSAVRNLIKEFQLT